MSTGPTKKKKKSVRQDRTSETNTQAQPTQDDETRRSTMPEIRDIYDPSEGSDERNEWQSKLYDTLRQKLSLEETLPEARDFSRKLDQGRDVLGAYTAHAFLLAHGWLLSEGFTGTDPISDEDIGRAFLRGLVPRNQRLSAAVISWAEAAGHDVWSWRVYRVINALAGVDSVDDASFEQYWPDVEQTGVEGLPLGFPSDRGERVSLVDGFVTGRQSIPKLQGSPQDPRSLGLRFPELWVSPLDGNTPDERAEIDRANQKKKRMYRAVRFLLNRDFGVTGLPLHPESFGAFAHVGRNGAISPPSALRLLGVMGSLLARNLDDPMLGRPVDARWPDDIVTKDDGPPIRITKRFADGVVAAMQEFTSRADLYAETQKLLAREGHRANGHTHVGLD
jgi:hypothetical protein